MFDNTTTIIKMRPSFSTDILFKTKKKKIIINQKRSKINVNI